MEPPEASNPAPAVVATENIPVRPFLPSHACGAAHISCMISAALALAHAAASPACASACRYRYQRLWWASILGHQVTANSVLLAAAAAPPPQGY